MYKSTEFLSILKKKKIGKKTGFLNLANGYRLRSNHNVVCKLERKKGMYTGKRVLCLALMAWLNIG